MYSKAGTITRLWFNPRIGSRACPKGMQIDRSTILALCSWKELGPVPETSDEI